MLRTSTHPVRNRPQSLDVVRCRFRFRMTDLISPMQNPAYSPPSTHIPTSGTNLDPLRAPAVSAT